MKLIRFALLPGLLAIGATAEPARDPQPGASQTVSEQRRVELREALKAQSGAEQGAKPQSHAGTSQNRHLSEQERADLRQQLRQNGPEANPPRP